MCHGCPEWTVSLRWSPAWMDCVVDVRKWILASKLSSVQSLLIYSCAIHGASL